MTEKEFTHRLEALGFQRPGSGFPRSFFSRNVTDVFVVTDAAAIGGDGKGWRPFTSVLADLGEPEAFFEKRRAEGMIALQDVANECGAAVDEDLLQWAVREIRALRKAASTASRLELDRVLKRAESSSKKLREIVEMAVSAEDAGDFVRWVIEIGQEEES